MISLNEYIIDQGVIIELSSVGERKLDAKEIYNIINNQTLSLKNSSIRFSKIGVNVGIDFNLEEGKIIIDFYAIKKNNKYEVQLYSDNRYLDYIVIDDTWHFLGGLYEQIAEILYSNKIYTRKELSFSEYMNLIKIFAAENIDFNDNVKEHAKNFKERNIDSLKGLHAKLFDYQNIGFNWLHFMKQNNCGCILADEMGLGKTIQIISLLGSEVDKNNDGHFLIIAPMSLLENWRREIIKFYPSLTVLVHHGRNRTGLYLDLLKYNVVITAYTSVKRDLSMLNMINWDSVILDEAQNIKTPYAERTKMVKMLKRKMGIAVTGTPFENHMTDIWSIVDFVFPGYLGNLNEFTEKYIDDYESAEDLETIITPIMIRRLVKDVAKDLPERVDIPQPIEMTYQEALLYEQERKENIEADLKSLAIDKIQSLRMFCTHPMVYNKNMGNMDVVEVSQKYARLCEILEEIIESKEKVIIFTSYNKMIDIMMKDLNYRFGVSTMYLNGEVDPMKRQETIDNFSAIVGSAILICNPRVAGAGLNITAANHVIHYNLEWNPAVEDQASARAYRRGQEKTVFVYRLYYINTIEEVMNDRIQNKRLLSETAIIGNNGTEQDKQDLIRALSLTPYKEEEYE